MNAILRTPARAAEPVSAREMKDLAENRAFNTFLGRIDKMIEDQRGVCESSNSSIPSLRAAQGALQALRTVRKLPGILIQELERKAAERRVP